MFGAAAPLTTLATCDASLALDQALVFATVSGNSYRVPVSIANDAKLLGILLRLRL